MLQIKESGTNQIQYEFSGNLSVSKMNEVHSQLIKLDFKPEKHYVKVSEVEHMDMSFFQLLYAFAVKLKKNKKELNFEFQLGDEYERLFQNSGLKSVFNQLINN